MTMPYGEGEGEHFKYSLFLVLMNRLTTCAVAIVMLVVRWLQRFELRRCNAGGLRSQEPATRPLARRVAVLGAAWEP